MIHKKLVTATGQRGIRASRTGTKKEREFLLNNLLQVFVFQPFKKLNAFFSKMRKKPISGIAIPTSMLRAGKDHLYVLEQDRMGGRLPEAEATDTHWRDSIYYRPEAQESLEFWKWILHWNPGLGFNLEPSRFRECKKQLRFRVLASVNLHLLKVFTGLSSPQGFLLLLFILFIGKFTVLPEFFGICDLTIHC